MPAGQADTSSSSSSRKPLLGAEILQAFLQEHKELAAEILQEEGSEQQEREEGSMAAVGLHQRRRGVQDRKQ